MGICSWRILLSRKYSAIIATLLLYAGTSFSQVGSWAYFTRGNRSYGLLDEETTATVPGHRYRPGKGVDANGNLLIFGSDNFGTPSSAAELSDVLRYNISTNKWAWIQGTTVSATIAVYGTQGIPDAANTPGGRNDMLSWNDSSGNMWIFGGFRYSNAPAYAGWLNDLWRFNPATKQWTWMHGSKEGQALGNYGTMGVPDPQNLPPPRDQSTCWTGKNGDFWLFGGTAYNKSVNNAFVGNDLWKFDGTNWTWLKGSKFSEQTSVYGTKGVEATSNTPCSSIFSASWTDLDGNLWLYSGGDKFISNDYMRNAMWKYNVTTGNWTWMSGSNIYASATPNYGTKGVTAATNSPGYRRASATWTDGNGDLWLFGNGASNDAYSDLWKYSINLNMWTWMAGPNVPNQNAVIGSPTIPHPDNNPRAFSYPTSWTDKNGQFWLLSETYLWKFSAAQSGITWEQVLQTIN